MAAPKSEQKSVILKLYLIVYNVMQTLGWSSVMCHMVSHVMNKGLNIDGLWEAVEAPLAIYQTGAVLEIVHSALGLVPSNVLVTLPQVFSRVFVLWPILYRVENTHYSIGLPLLLFAWTVTEILRYLYYTLNLLNSLPAFLTWCRYSFFVALYPIGITGELLCCYAALPYYQSTLDYSIQMPNFVNFAFDFHYFIALVMLSYIPVFPQLYGHMFAQRKKVLGKVQKQD